MAQVKIGQFTFGEDTFTLRYVLEKDVVRFVARDVASCLKYSDTKKAVKAHVDQKYTHHYQGGHIAPPAPTGLVKRGDPLYLQPNTVLVTKSGVIQLIMKSKLPYAVELQEWLLEEVIPRVLCTGKYDPAIKECQNQIKKQQEENKQLVAKLLATFTDQTNALQQQLVKKQEFIEHIVAVKDKQIEARELQVTRVMADLNRMYSGFQDTMQRKDEIMQKRDELLQIKDAQVTALVAKVVDLSGRAVRYPEDARKHPVLCVARDGTTFTAIAGQQAYVQGQKHKRRIDPASVVAEATRPNPAVDWNNVTHRVAGKRTKRSVSFDSERDARQFEEQIKQLLRN